MYKEFEIGQQLEHPNLVKYLNYGTDEEGEFVLTEYVDGDTLNTVIAKTKDFISGKLLIALFIRDILPAVKYLHNKEIIHGDISPNNIIYDKTANRLYLIDYGHTKNRSFVSLRGGTNNFVSPEAVNTPALVNQSSDIYSIGKILELITSVYSVKGYKALITKCCVEIQAHRLQSVESLQQYTSRSKLIVLFVAMFFALLLTCGFTVLYLRHNANVVSVSKITTQLKKKSANLIEKNTPVVMINQKYVDTNDKMGLPVLKSNDKVPKIMPTKISNVDTAMDRNTMVKSDAVYDLKPTAREANNNGHYVLFKYHHAAESLKDESYDIVTRPIEVSSMIELQQVDTFYELLHRIFKITRFNVNEIEFIDATSHSYRRTIMFKPDRIIIGSEGSNQVVLPVYSLRSDAMKEFYSTVHNSSGKQLMVIDKVKL